MQEREFKYIKNIQKKCQARHTIQAISLRGQERQKYMIKDYGGKTWRLWGVFWLQSTISNGCNIKFQISKSISGSKL